MYAIFVTGGRHFADHAAVSQAFEAEWRETGQMPDLVVDGGMVGADTLCSAFARDVMRVQTQTLPADWSVNGKSGGPIRNIAMRDYALNIVQSGGRVKLLVFPGGAGTRHMVSVWAAAGLPLTAL